MKLKKYVLGILFLAILLGFMPTSNAGNLSISFSKSNAKVGDTVTATIKGNGVSGKVNLSVSGNATLSTNSVFVDGSASVTVKINGEGNIKVTATAADMAETSNAKVYNGSTSGTIKVASNNSSSTSNTGTSSSNNSSSNENEKKTETTSTKSNNANLSSLGIKPNDFKGFKASKTSYDVTVPSDTEKVTVYATAQDKKATIKGNGTQKLNQGKNSLNVVVTAEDGTTKTYTINVTREEGSNTTNDTNSNTTEETTDEEENQEDSVSDLKSLSIKGFNLEPAFSPDVYEYKENVNGDISSLDIETEGANHGVSVDIVGNENLTDGENTITLLVYNDETKQNSTYQIIVNKTSADVDGLNSDLTEAVKKANRIRCIIIGVVVFIIVGIVIFIIVKHRLKAKTTDNKMYEYDDEDKERLNLDDEDEFFSRVTNQKNEKSVDVENNVVEKIDKNNEVSEYDVDDYFRTNKPKKKGKHF